MKIGAYEIGNFKRVFVVAELSANHNQSFEIASKTVKAAKDSGADAIKLQTYTPDTITIDCDNEYFRIKQGTIWDGLTLYKLYQQAFTPWDWQPKLKKLAESLGLVFFSSPFDPSSVDFLEKLNVPAYKIASFEITDLPLIEYIARKGKPVLISTGVATIQEIKEAIETCKQVGNQDIVLLKCTSSYPAPIEEANIATIPDMIRNFGLSVGLSDHTLGHTVVIAAVALGACVVEKHLILNRNLGGPDASFSIEPQEFRHMVEGIRETEKSLGDVSYNLSPRISGNRYFCRSLFVVQDMLAGETFTENNIRSIRPGIGLAPKFIKDIIGKKARCALKRGTPLQRDCVQ